MPEELKKAEQKAVVALREALEAATEFVYSKDGKDNYGDRGSRYPGPYDLARRSLAALNCFCASGLES